MPQCLGICAQQNPRHLPIREDSKIFELLKSGFRNSSEGITLASEIAGEKLGVSFQRPKLP